MRILGLTVYRADRRVAVRRAGRLLPARGERWFWVGWNATRFLLRWEKWQGIRVVSVHRHRTPDEPITFYRPEEFTTVPIKRRTPLAEPVPLPALPATSKVLAKCPLLCEFLSATAYEDGSARQPGYVTLRNRVIEWELTLYDPDAGARVALRARTLDDVFATAEVLLSSAEAPWEPDRYLMEQLARKPKKKGK